jgi:lysyl-tRNA synthetase class 2
LSLEDELLEQRLERIREIEALGFRPYGQRFEFSHTIPAILAEYAAKTAEELASPVRVRIAGRVQTLRRMGKAGFAHLAQAGERLQIYIKKDAIPERDFAIYQLIDVGDIIGVEGYLFRTRTGELSVHVEHLEYLAKTLLSMPEKWHGLEDVETRYRQRYLDLIANPEVRKVFLTRSRIISSLRRQLESHDFVEVETPMMQPLYGGAAARPFVTHHNTLDIDLYLRIAPELYLKRLTVGGFERVYEINRNFRNEGVSTQHNPEFTMLELYQAYADYTDLMEMIETLFQGIADSLLGSRVLDYQGTTIDLSKPFARSTIEEILTVNNPDLDPTSLRDLGYLRRVCDAKRIAYKGGDGAGKLQIELFEKTGEHTLVQPTFAYAYPAEVSPLSRRNDRDPFVTDRWEFFIGGRELANGFSELNDSEDQAQRFRDQVERKAGGDEEAMYYDADYVRALEYGMPPTAGLGLGVDRVVMLFANAPSIRDVLLFPHMRPEL